MRLLGYCRILAVAAVFCLLPTTVLGQEFSQIKRNNNAPPKPSGPTPRTADGHPDLTGVWNGLGDNLLGNGLLAAHRVDGNDGPAKVEQRQ